MTFKRLSGKATAADIHMGVKGKTGSVVVRLCRPCTSGQKGTATLRSSVLNAFKLNELYVDIHTAKNPKGEIRGQIAGM